MKFRPRLAGAGVLLATALLAAAGTPAAAAAAATQPAVRPASPQAAEALVTRLGDRSAGAYLDGRGRMVVTVTDQQAAATVRRAGAVPRLVGHSGAELRQADATLYHSARIAGTAWVIDPVADQVVVSADNTVTGSRLSRLTSVAAALGDRVRIERLAGSLRTYIAGGAAIYGSQYRCSLGFNVRNSAGAGFFLTAGHCGNLAAAWYSDLNHRTQLGTRVGSSFPGNDYAMIRYTNGRVNTPGEVTLYNGQSQDVTSAANPVVGESVKRSGSTTHVHGGQVRGLNATVNYAEGTVRGLIKTNVCAEGGDSGGPLFHGSTALGLTSGGSGNCSSGGTTFYQPVKEALAHFHVSIY